MSLGGELDTKRDRPKCQNYLYQPQKCPRGHFFAGYQCPTGDYPHLDTPRGALSAVISDYPTNTNCRLVTKRTHLSPNFPRAIPGKTGKRWVPLNARTRRLKSERQIFILIHAIATSRHIRPGRKHHWPWDRSALSQNRHRHWTRRLRLHPGDRAASAACATISVV